MPNQVYLQRADLLTTKMTYTQWVSHDHDESDGHDQHPYGSLSVTVFGVKELIQHYADQRRQSSTYSVALAPRLNTLQL